MPTKFCKKGQKLLEIEKKATKNWWNNKKMVLQEWLKIAENSASTKEDLDRKMIGIFLFENSK